MRKGTASLSSTIVILAGITAALHMGKVSPALYLLEDAFSLTLIQTGFLVSLIQLAGMLTALFVGLSADSFGLKRSIATGLTLLTLASLIGSLATTPASLFASRMLEGFGFLLIVISAPGLIRQLVPLERLNLTLGIWGCFMGAGMGMALLLGPWVTGQLGWQGWWWGLAIWTLLILLCLLLLVPSDPSRNVSTTDSRQAQDESWTFRIRLTLSLPGPWLIAGCFALYASQWLSVIGFLPSIYLQAGLTGPVIGVLTALVASSNIIGNLVSAHLMHRGIAAHHILYTGFASMALFAFLTFHPLTNSLPNFRFASVLMFSVMGGLVPGALFAQAVSLAPSENTISTTVGWMQQWSALGQFAGPPAVALLASWVGGWQWTWSLTATFSILAILLVFRLGRLPHSTNSPSSLSASARSHSRPTSTQQHH